MLTKENDINSLIDWIYKLNAKEQEEISRLLNELLLEKRIKNFIESKKDIPLSIEETTQEVEKERSARYICYM